MGFEPMNTKYRCMQLPLLMLVSACCACFGASPLTLELGGKSPAVVLPGCSIAEAARMITVVDVNDATLALYGVHDKAALLGPLDTTLDISDPVMRAGLMADVLLIAGGGRRAQRESRAVTPSGKRIDVEIRDDGMIWALGRSEAT